MLKENSLCNQAGKQKATGSIDWRKCIISGILGFGVTLLLCLIFSWLMCRGALNLDMAGFFAYTALFCGGTAAAFLASGKTRKMLEALPACGVILVLLAVCGALFFGGMRLGAAIGAALLLTVAAFAGAALSGLRK